MHIHIDEGLYKPLVAYPLYSQIVVNATDGGKFLQFIQIGSNIS